MRPNLVLMLIDDLGWMDLSCYGSAFYETPRLDRLASEGVRFTQAYAAAPICSPTRAAILSGKSPARVGVTQWIGGHAVGRLCDVPYFQALPQSERSLATALREGEREGGREGGRGAEGYQTWHVGKWHLGTGDTSPEAHGFDVNRGGCGWGAPHHGYFSPYRCPTLADGPEGEYLTDRLTDEAVALIRGRDKERPFYLNLWHYAVHTPMQAPAALVEKYRAKAERMGLPIDGPEAVVAGKHFSCQHKRDERIERRVVQSHPVYAAMIENLDTNLGRVLDALAEEGIADDTLVLFTSDNGGLATAEGSPTCNAPLAEGKGWLNEGGHRVCQIARWPGRAEAGRTCDVPVVSTDVYPTFLDAAGLDPDPQQHVDGVSMLPLLEEGDGDAAGSRRIDTRGSGGSGVSGGFRGPGDRDAIYWHYPHYSNQGGTPGCTMVSGGYKLIEYFEDGRLELYDLENDTSESRDVSKDQPEKCRDLHAKLVAWRGEVEALIPKVNPNWRPTERQAGEDAAAV